METKRKCKVVMLASNNASRLWTHAGDLHLSKEASSNYKSQHLYITSDDEIKEGDWYTAGLHTSIVFRADAKFNKNRSNNPNGIHNSRKIIATTDTSLRLPSPSPEFIAKYVEEYNKGNQITDVMVTYEMIMGDAGILAVAFKEDEYQLKVDKYNYITITRVKDSWNRDEVKRAISHCVAAITSHDKTTFIGMKMWQDKVDQWIEENL